MPLLHDAQVPTHPHFCVEGVWVYIVCSCSVWEIQHITHNNTHRLVSCACAASSFNRLATPCPCPNTNPASSTPPRRRLRCATYSSRNDARERNRASRSISTITSSTAPSTEPLVFTSDTSHTGCKRREMKRHSPRCAALHMGSATGKAAPISKAEVVVVVVVAGSASASCC